ncbi:MAG: hypothetical protein FIA99_17350 [Ruminiclostridium sp.]|nr:hypothetical protein [Ruminiclostridium sp.]
MGYTHYYGFRILAPTFKKEAVADIEAILAEYADLLQLDANEKLPPICEPGLICFNGKGENAHESLYITPDITGATCKTNRRPYDLPVCEVLLILKHYYKAGFDLSSDGLWVGKNDLVSKTLDGNWNEALQKIEQRFGYQYDLLPKITGSNGHNYYCFILKAL